MTTSTTQSGTAYTPGPWAYRPNEHDDWGFVRAPVTEQGQLVGGVICQAYDPEARDAVTLAKHREAGTDPWEANARLIAAAPSLVEAASAVAAVLAPFAKEGGDVEIFHSVALNTDGIAKLITALRLALGETE